MRRHSIAFSFAHALTLAGCSLPGSGDGGRFGAAGDDTEDSASGGGQVILGPVAGGGSGLPTSTAGTSGASGAGGSPAPAGPPPPRVSAWPGFTLLPGLGVTCPIAAADDPATQYGSLQTKPCATGASGCAEPVWNGLTPGAAEAAVEPRWDVDVVADDQGVASHLIVTRRYGAGTQGSELVVYDLADGAAVAGFRNGEPSLLPFLPALQSACMVTMVGARGRAWMVVSEAGVTRVASAEIGELGAELELSPIDVDATVIDGSMLGGPERLALEAEDGQLYLVTTSHEVTATYGPDVRVWLSGPAPGGVLVSAQGRDGLQSSYYFMDAAGGFTPLLTDAIAAGSDGASLAWIERAADQSVLRLASAGADGGFDVMGAQSLPIVRVSDSGVSSAPVTFSLVRELRVGDGRVVVHGTIGANFTDSAFVLGTDGRLLAEVPIDTGSPVLGLQGPYLWRGVGLEDRGAFQTLQRVEY